MMEIDHKLRFSNMMARACAAYQTKPLDKETIGIYFEELSRFPMDEVEEQLRGHIRTERFFPKIADLVPPVSDRRATALGPAYIEPPRMSNTMAMANRLLLIILQQKRGVDSNTMEQLIQLKRRLVAEAGDAKVTKELVQAMREELSDVADGRNLEHLAAETALARRRYAKRHGYRVES